MDTVQTINAIAVNPAIRNNRAYILGTTVTVADVAIAKIYHGLDVDGIAERRSAPKFDVPRSLRRSALAARIRFYLDENVPMR